MDFGDSAPEAAFRAGLREWLAARRPFPPVPAGDAARAAHLSTWHRDLHDAGYVGVSFPEEYGGRGLDPVHEAIVLEELGAAGAPSPWHFGYVARVILDYGSEEQKRRFLPPAFRGEERWCQGFSEPDAGSDLASLRTRAERDGDAYVVTGRKVWTSEAHTAQWCFLLARTEPDRPAHAGLTCLLLPLDLDGVDVRPFRQLTGSLEFAEVVLDGVRVPASLVVGRPGDGWRIAMSTVALERGPADVGFIADFRRTLGGLLDAVAGARTPPAGDLAIRLARAEVDLEVLRVHVLRSLSRRQRGEGSEVDASVDKLLMTRTEQGLAHVAMDLAGGGALVGDAAETLRQYLWSRAASVYGGTSEIQRTIVAERLLRLPRHH